MDEKGVLHLLINSFSSWFVFALLFISASKFLSEHQCLIDSNMPNVFKFKYLTTRVIIDATEVFVVQPALPELQQLTFSSYKNHNTYKGLIGISPSGAVTFISELYTGSISDKELTRRCGLLELLEPGDSVMADKGFNIKDDLELVGVKLNIPPFFTSKAITG